MMNAYDEYGKVVLKKVGIRVQSERGVALVLVLVLSTIGLLVMTTVMYVIMMGTQLSGSKKSYRTAYDAALGGMDVMRKIIQDQGAVTIPGVPITYRDTFLAKLNAPTLPAAGLDTSISIDPNTPSTYDLSMDLGSPVYRVYAKMIQKQQGNTNKGYKTVIVKTGVVPAEPGMGEVHSTFYFFHVLSQSTTNTNERVRMDIVSTF